jgi:hypothetical protein
MTSSVVDFGPPMTISTPKRALGELGLYGEKAIHDLKIGPSSWWVSRVSDNN